MTPYFDDGRCRIYHGDCREILPALGESFDLLLTDPPYAISSPGFFESKPGSRRRFDFFADDDDHERMTSLVLEALALALARCRPGASAWVWCGHRYFGSVVGLLEASGRKTRPFAWVKAVPAPAPPGSLQSCFELCAYGRPSGATFNARSRQVPNIVTADSYRHGQPGKVAHPTQKPDRVLRPAVELSSLPGDAVLDPFMGSGTTVRVAKDLGRRAVGIEIDERYCEIAAKRLAQQAMQFDEVTG